MGKFGDFEETESEGEEVKESDESTRVRMPRNGEVIGVIIQRLGGNRMEVKSTNGKTRNCRVPGRYKRSLWLRPKDIVLIKPWADDDEKGDVIYKYNFSAINQLRKRGILDSITESF